MSNSNASAAVQPSKAAIEHVTVAMGVFYEKLVAAFEAELGRVDPAAVLALVERRAAARTASSSPWESTTATRCCKWSGTDVKIDGDELLTGVRHDGNPRLSAAPYPAPREHRSEFKWQLKM